MQIANAIADYDYYKNSRADTAAITARERKKTETRPRRYVAARLVACLSVSSPLSPPPLGFSLRLLVVSFMSSAFLLRRHLAFCQLASFLIFLCHQKTKKKILFFLRLKLLLFWATSCSYSCSRQDFHCRSSVSSVLPFTIFIAGDAKSIKVQLLLSISQRERNYSKCFDYSHTHTYSHTDICVFVVFVGMRVLMHFVSSSHSSRPLHFWLRLFAFLLCAYARSLSLALSFCRHCSSSSFVYVSTHICCCSQQRHWQRYRRRQRSRLQREISGARCAGLMNSQFSLQSVIKK